jgi:hypothetical protein
MRFDRKLRKHFGQTVKTALSLLLVVQMLFVLALAACPLLHHAFHHDSDKPGHECLVTAFVKGQLSEAGVPPVTAVLAAFIVFGRRPPTTRPRSLFAFHGAANRGPPGH